MARMRMVIVEGDGIDEAMVRGILDQLRLGDAGSPMVLSELCVGTERRDAKPPAPAGLDRSGALAGGEPGGTPVPPEPPAPSATPAALEPTEETIGAWWPRIEADLDRKCPTINTETPLGPVLQRVGLPIAWLAPIKREMRACRWPAWKVGENGSAVRTRERARRREEASPPPPPPGAAAKEHPWRHRVADGGNGSMALRIVEAALAALPKVGDSRPLYELTREATGNGLNATYAAGVLGRDGRFAVERIPDHPRRARRVRRVK